MKRTKNFNKTSSAVSPVQKKCVSPTKPTPEQRGGRAPRQALRVDNISSIERPASQAAPYSLIETQSTIAYELLQGALVRYSASNGRHPPTAVLVHGILGSRRNMQSFARKILEAYPSWQILLVDLRCHGDSASLYPPLASPHNVASAAADVLRLLSALKMFPEILVGHSFGGKVVMAMAEQFGKGVKTLPRPVKVWVLDALPGEVRSGEMGAKDRPADLITSLQRTPVPIESRALLITQLERRGFSPPVAAWAATNLVPAGPGGGYTWGFDLGGIASMYRSYETTSLWNFLTSPAKGIHVSFVRAERSTFRWGGGDADRIEQLGHHVYVLPNSGHWVHTDNPDGLFDILAPSFGDATNMLRRSQSGSASPNSSN